MKTCPQCGGQSGDRSQYCYQCGAPLDEPKAKAATVPQAPLVAKPGPAQPEPPDAKRPATTVDDPAIGVGGLAAEPAGDPAPPAEQAAKARPAVRQPPGPADAERLAAEARSKATAAPGTVVDGKYAIERVLGEGGMGIVYLARELHTGVEVVLKAVRADLAHRAEVRRRTFAEGRALARIDHANVVQLKAVVSEPDELWLVMQYIAGESLEQLIERHAKAGVAMSLDEALGVFRQVIAGVSAAHREGLIHRDLKPGNILIRSKDGVVKVTDFGIAKVEQDARAGRGQTKGFIGSPYYTSPEQVTGQRDLDRRVDIYALGVLLYEMLTCKVPFDHESTFEIMRMHTEVQFPKVTALRPDLPPALDDVLRCACAKEREQRYGSCEEMLQALEAVVAPPPVQPSVLEPTPQPPDARLGTVSAVATALPAQPAAGSARGSRFGWVALLVVLLGLGTVGVLFGVGVLRLPRGQKPARTAAPTAVSTPSPPPSTSSAVVQPPPLARLEGRWVSDSGRELDAVFIDDSLEFRVVNPKQFAPQDYRAGEPRFVLHAVADKESKFAVEDRIRPNPPAGYKWDSAKARNTCYAVWRDAKGSQLFALYDGKQLSVDFAKIEPTHDNFTVVGRTVIGCRGLEKLKATRLPSLLRRR